MPLTILHYPSPRAEARLAAISGRCLDFRKKDLQAVERILADVRREGDAALVRYTRRFDSPAMGAADLRVSAAELDAAGGQVSRAFKTSLQRAAAQIEAFHRQQVRPSWMDAQRPGVLLGQLVHPVDAAGVYVPGGQGGRTPLVSSVLMGAIPARIAGVARIVMVTPPSADVRVNPHLLAAARLAGVHEVYRVGSAWAIAALAYGTPSIPRVDVIVGPGNLYVTLAKKLVAGSVGIDMLAGPSEILIVADAGADPALVAADMLSQAEHDPLASAVLLTDHEPLARQVARELEDQLARLTRAAIAGESLRRFGTLMVVPDMATAVELSNRIAPEHLELLVRTPMDLVGHIRHAGAVFLGPYTPEPVGDYLAGPNHVLPTAGTARFASALSVDAFVKKTSLLRYTREALQREAAHVIRLAEIEGLDAHAQAVRLRLAQRPAAGRQPRKARG
jgi:histidinol dehydrogenase